MGEVFPRTMVAEEGAFCVQSVEAKDAATAKHPPNAHPRQRILWVQSQVSGLLRLRNARGAVMKERLVHPKEDSWIHY